jgi:hypothetical protein
VNCPWKRGKSSLLGIPSMEGLDISFIEASALAQPETG